MNVLPRMPLAQLADANHRRRPVPRSARRAGAVSAHPDQARRSDRPGARRQQGAEAGVSDRRRVGKGRAHRGDDRRRAVESCANDGGGRENRRAAGRPRADREGAINRRPRAISCSTICTARMCDSCRRSIPCSPSATTRSSSRRSSRKKPHRAGRTYVIPVGGSSAVGAVGYVYGTAELVEQLRAMDVVAVAAVLRQRLARHAGGPDTWREAQSGAVQVVGRRGLSGRTGKNRARAEGGE